MREYEHKRQKPNSPEKFVTLRKVKREGRGQPTARWMVSVTMPMSATQKDMNSIPHNLSMKLQKFLLMLCPNS